VDLQAWLDRRQTLYCGEPSCSRRIAWTTFKRAFTHSAEAWRWQGKGVPIRYRRVGEQAFIDLECFSCGWQATYEMAEVLVQLPLAAKVMMAPDILARATREAEQRLAEAS
jgi:hypothetical protein